jgi:hypothetical protein
VLFILVGTAGLDLPAMRSWELLFEVIVGVLQLKSTRCE